MISWHSDLALCFFPSKPDAFTRLQSKLYTSEELYSNWGYQDSFIYLFIYERYFKCKKHKQKQLSNIQPNNLINKKSI